MARYVLVEFDDDAKADALCAQINAAADAGKNYRLAGVFFRPTRWCNCPLPSGYHKGQLALGSKYGVWTCIVCRRPRPGTHQPHNLIPFAELRKPPTKMGYRVTTIGIHEVPTKPREA